MTEHREVHVLDALLVGDLDQVSADVAALLQTERGPLAAREIARRTGHTIRDVVNALCSGERFSRVFRGVYELRK